MEIITSRQNKLYKHIKNLKEDKKYRRQSREFWVDGVNFVAQALDNNWTVKKIVYVPDEINTDFKKQIVASTQVEEKIAFSAELYASLSSKKDIQGIGAIVEEKSQLNEFSSGKIVVLEHISNPGNLGTIMRTCAAFGVEKIAIVNPAVDPFSFEVVRSSMGAVFHLQISIFDSIQSLEKELSQKNISAIGTSLQDDSQDIRSLTLKTDNVALFFGNEAKGLTPEARKLCSSLLHIPMTDNVDSLNISESVGITLWELMKEKLSK